MQKTQDLASASDDLAAHPVFRALAFVASRLELTTSLHVDSLTQSNAYMQRSPASMRVFPLAEQALL
jgi:hypothetical protein